MHRGKRVSTNGMCQAFLLVLSFDNEKTLEYHRQLVFLAQGRLMAKANNWLQRGISALTAEAYSS